MRFKLKPLRTFGFLLRDVSRRYVQHFDQRAGALRLTLPQCKVLVYLANHEGITQVQLAELTDLEPMTLVRVLDENVPLTGAVSVRETRLQRLGCDIC